MSTFKARIFKSTLRGHKVISIDFKIEELDQIKNLMNKIGIKIKECGY